MPRYVLIRTDHQLSETKILGTTKFPSTLIYTAVIGKACLNTLNYNGAFI